jgi:predicted dehydrogenase
MRCVNRRRFLHSTTLAGATLLSQSAAGADDPVRIAIIGVGGRGNQLMREFAKIPFVQIGAVVDPDGNRTEQAAGWVRENTGHRPIAASDMRTVFDDPSIHAVLVSTTNHWHALTAIWAMQAGKDVYLEKPVSYNIFEGQKVVEAARKYDRIVQGGTQRRSGGRWRKAIQLMHEGTIGDIYLSKWVFPGNRNSIGFKPVEPPPNWLNWDLWVGPAQMEPYHGNLVHYNWHWFWNFGNGELGNNGPHLADIARWAMQKELPVRVRSWGGRWGYTDQAETPNTQTVEWEFDDGRAMHAELRGLYTAEPMSWDFFGTKGHLHLFADGRCSIRLGRNKQQEPEPEPLPDENHYQNFAEAVRSRNRATLNAEVNETVLSTAFCHLGNIAYRVGEELHFDPKIQRFLNNDIANSMLTRNYRAPYIVPETV